MILIFGGAYQGKLEYVLEEYNLSENDVFTCSRDKALIDPDKKIIYGLHNFVYACVTEGIEAREFFDDNPQLLENKIIICDDISQGIVPLDKTERAWREACGRTMVYLGKKAHSVIRIFCGLANVIK